jgi:Fic family protein
MVYTEILERNGKKYYYRVESIRNGKKVSKRKKYLGVDLDKQILIDKEKNADISLGLLSSLLTKEEIKSLDKIKKEFSKESSLTIDNRYEAFCTQFTYDSNAIEGNTLSLQETSELLFDGLVPKKSLREVNESLNHKNAFDYLLKYKEDINKELILKLHSLVVKNTLKKNLVDQVGIYRKSQVFLRGVEWLPPTPKEVPKEMTDLLTWYSKNKDKLHPVVLASYFHIAFETIHPFIDGNGRTGRLLMNFILRTNKYPMVNIPNKNKRTYYAALNEAQVNGNLRKFVEMIIEILVNSKLQF